MTNDNALRRTWSGKKTCGNIAIIIGLMLAGLWAIGLFIRNDAVIRFPMQSGEALTIDVNIKSVNGIISPWMYSDAGEDFFFRPEVATKKGDIILSTGLLYNNLSDEQRESRYLQLKRDLMVKRYYLPIGAVACLFFGVLMRIWGIRNQRNFDAFELKLDV
ncbi:MAG: hypothetical protein PHR28_08390 [candidate division Zixibacteria bacterium]|nr:hypothetical protein [candidate division Zixibacteria bacterium]